VTGAPHQVSETNFLDSAQVRVVHPPCFAPFHHLFDVERPPAHVAEKEF
jgi:hypothetical protein